MIDRHAGLYDTGTAISLKKRTHAHRSCVQHAEIRDETDRNTTNGDVHRVGPAA
jgi:hypothetical protein